MLMDQKRGRQGSHSFRGHPKKQEGWCWQSPEPTSTEGASGRPRGPTKVAEDMEAGPWMGFGRGRNQKKQ